MTLRTEICRRRVAGGQLKNSARISHVSDVENLQPPRPISADLVRVVNNGPELKSPNIFAKYAFCSGVNERHLRHHLGDANSTRRRFSKVSPTLRPQLRSIPSLPAESDPSSWRWNALMSGNAISRGAGRRLPLGEIEEFTACSLSVCSTLPATRWETSDCAPFTATSMSRMHENRRVADLAGRDEQWTRRSRRVMKRQPAGTRWYGAAPVRRSLRDGIFLCGRQLLAAIVTLAFATRLAFHRRRTILPPVERGWINVELPARAATGKRGCFATTPADLRRINVPA